MWKPAEYIAARSLAAIAIVLVSGIVLFAQADPPARTIFRDSDGNIISNNEFVDIRMANYHLPDRTLIRTLNDGTIEFRLQKVPQEGALAPNFSGKYIDGSPADFEDLRGKVIVLNFWFTGCEPCRYEIPRLNLLANEFSSSSDVVFIAVTYDPASVVRRYLRSNPFEYKMMTDSETLLSKFVVGGYPKNIVIGKDGRIAYWRSTVKAWDKFESVIRSELAK